MSMVYKGTYTDNELKINEEIKVESVIEFKNLDSIVTEDNNMPEIQQRPNAGIAAFLPLRYY